MQNARALEAEVIAIDVEEILHPLTSLELEVIAGGAVICNDD